MQPTVKHFEITARDGLVLRGEAFGDSANKATPLLCLPGLTRTSRDFHPLAERLATDPDHPRFVLTLNSRGRGSSDYDKNPENYNVITEARDAIDAITAAGLHEVIILGTSRGGLLMLAIAAIQPNLIAGAIFNDIGPILDATGIARIKTYLTRSEPVKTWEDAVAYVKTANHKHFFGLAEEDWERMARMTFRDEGGVPKSDFDPYIAKALESIDLSETKIDLWPQFMALSHCPTLVLRGETSDILAATTAKEMVNRHPDCQLFEAKGHGHAPLLFVDSINDRIDAFLQEVDSKRQARLPQTDPAWLSEDEITYIADPNHPSEASSAPSSESEQDLMDDPMAGLPI
ncbi:Pimeloyl-ACP methyl ester carboxylesterase [Cohaesibacter marisflavi]|uniref:Pimeloyl-ACP methyl ester carboxylesterase n=1 Tax=Cohaesibacter marisflavi TaxID=655353 RepID=A0A1I5K8K2_9HYPH|nr:alpha/beta hydrolase [Cohaesibacter marisflavi]SFO81053.1 Pimeloyl-ACP methyl ester carboxylesterase [Cohaesibacter marisflavi]